LRSFDVCLLLASQGAFHYSPLKLLEYMACGRAIVAPRVGDVPLTVSDGAEALLVEPGVAKPVIDAVATLASDPLLRNRLGASARRMVERSESWEARAASLTQVLRSRRLLRTSVRELTARGNP
jgi:glycosyltransferase involved in cell wall biosynthesis